MKRKCVYTGNDSLCTDRVIPSHLAGEEVHNWANTAPSSIEYKESKDIDPPTELEMEINETFHKWELAKLRAKFYEIELNRLQALNKDSRKPIKKTGASQRNKEKQKEIEIKKSIEINEIVKDNKDNIDKFLNDRKEEILKPKKSIWE